MGADPADGREPRLAGEPGRARLLLGAGVADDVVVVGAGLVGLSTAMALLEARPGLRVTVVEKEHRVAAHQSGRNSGVLHAGLYYEPGSLKARFCREGRTELIRFAGERGIPYRQCGKLVVAAAAASCRASRRSPRAAAPTG